MTDFTSAIFVDTSVQLLRFVGRRDVKAQVNQRLGTHGLSVTSLVVRQEFKRRFMTDVKYLRTALEKNDYDPAETGRYLKNKLSSPHNRRKLSLSLEILFGTGFNGRDLDDMGRSCHLILKAWESSGLKMFDRSVGHVIRASGCGCGASEKFSPTPTKCGVIKTCKINEFLQQRQSQAQDILAFLQSANLPPKTKEIDKAEAMLGDWLSGKAGPDSNNPCLTVGDLIIALESEGIPAFYTQNAKESQFFCRAQEQTMIVQRDEGDEIQLAADRDQWPSYTNACV